MTVRRQIITEMLRGIVAVVEPLRVAPGIPSACGGDDAGKSVVKVRLIFTGSGFLELEFLCFRPYCKSQETADLFRFD